ncbi:MAG: YebC/PmpR family DNA-binding transcriptional regulator [Arsenophonus sp.]|nr:MAG: YebC/PmpR family DNA-binding transcriptional regulator [Arsenophonus sp.]
MSGHSKWANTKYRKAAQDSKREKKITKIIRDLYSASRLYGNNPTSNSKLRVLIDKALSNNVNKSVLNKIIFNKKNEKEKLQSITYEGYGPGGIAILLKCLTNNRKRTISYIRHVFSKYNANLGISGSVSYLFVKRGLLSFYKDKNEDKLLEIALENDIEDIELSNNYIFIYTHPKKIYDIKNILNKFGFQSIKNFITIVPIKKIKIEEKEIALKLNSFIQSLKKIHDVVNVYHNYF